MSLIRVLLILKMQFVYMLYESHKQKALTYSCSQITPNFLQSYEKRDISMRKRVEFSRISFE